MNVGFQHFVDPVPIASFDYMYQYDFESSDMHTTILFIVNLIVHYENLIFCFERGSQKCVRHHDASIRSSFTVDCVAANLFTFLVFVSLSLSSRYFLLI